MFRRLNVFNESLSDIHIVNISFNLYGPRTRKPHTQFETRTAKRKTLSDREYVNSVPRSAIAASNINLCR